jgi:undecaprenyl-diphosphatase
LGTLYNPRVETLKYLLLGLIQGLTEFLPVSSSGHLVLAEHWLKLNPPGIALEVAVHVATLVSVLVVYWRDLRDIFAKGNWRYLGLLALSTAVTVAIILPFKGYLERLTEGPDAVRIVGGMLLITAIWLFAADHRLRQTDSRMDPGWLGAVFLGIAQACAAIPGLSRSGATIGAAVQAGLTREAAARYSFLLSVPVIAGAGILVAPEAVAVYREGTLNLAGLAIAMLAALVAGIAAIYTTLWVLRRARLVWFALYCVIVGGLALYLG